MNVLDMAGGVGDRPGPPQKLRRHLSHVLDPHLIGPDEMAFVRARLVLKENGPDADPDPGILVDEHVVGLVNASGGHGVAVIVSCGRAPTFINL